MSRRNPSLVLMATVWWFCVLSACAGTTTAGSGESVASDAQDNGGSSLDTPKTANDEQLASILGLQADAEYGAYLAGECLTCHTPNTANGAIPVVHGKDKAYLALALLQYKRKDRSNEVMQGVSAALSDEDIAALATYLSEQ